MSDVTRILSQIESGDPAAADKLLPLVTGATLLDKLSERISLNVYSTSSHGRRHEGARALHATTSQALGVSPRAEPGDMLGRPLAVSDGDVLTLF